MFGPEMDLKESVAAVLLGGGGRDGKGSSCVLYLASSCGYRCSKALASGNAMEARIS